MKYDTVGFMGLNMRSRCKHKHAGQNVFYSSKYLLKSKTFVKISILFVKRFAVSVIFHCDNLLTFCNFCPKTMTFYIKTGLLS